VRTPPGKTHAPPGCAVRGARAAFFFTRWKLLLDTFGGVKLNHVSRSFVEEEEEEEEEGGAGGAVCPCPSVVVVVVDRYTWLLAVRARPLRLTQRTVIRLQ